MTAMARLVAAFAAILALAVMPEGARADDPRALQPLAQAITGRWKVESVLINRESERTVAYQLDDPELIGNTFSINQDKIESTTAEARQCAKPGAVVWQISAEKLIETTLAPTKTNAPSTVAGYHFPAAPDTPINAMFVTCGAGRFGPQPTYKALEAIGAKNTGTWIVVLPTGKLAIRWFDDTILLLARA